MVASRFSVALLLLVVLTSVTAGRAHEAETHVYSGLDGAFDHLGEMLDALLQGSSDEGAKTVADAAANAPGNMSFLTSAVGRAELTNVIQNPDWTATIFAPTNRAFEAALLKMKITPKQLYADKAALSNILSLHVVNEKAIAIGELKHGQELDTVQGTKLKVHVDKVAGTHILGADDDAKIVVPDIRAGKCIIHVIDTLLVPAKPST